MELFIIMIITIGGVIGLIAKANQNTSSSVKTVDDIKRENEWKRLKKEQEILKNKEMKLENKQKYIQKQLTPKEKELKITQDMKNKIRGTVTSNSQKGVKALYAFDTNVLLKNSDVLKVIEKQPILISRKVFDELDKKKTEDGDIGFSARKAIRNIEEIQKKYNRLSFAYISEQEVKNMNLDPKKADDVIIASYVKVQEAEAKNNKKIMFFSHDRGIRTIARDFDLKAIGVKSENIS